MFRRVVSRQNCLCFYDVRKIPARLAKVLLGRTAMNHSEQPEAAPFPARGKGDIDGWRVRLYFLSRDPHLLIWIAVIIIGIGVALGKMWQPEDPLAQLEKTMRISTHGCARRRTRGMCRAGAWISARNC